MARRIKLTRADAATQPYKRFEAHRMQVTASNAEEMPNTVFVFQRLPGTPYGSSPADDFVTVATALDLSAYPENTPVDGSDFFRKAVVVLDFHTPEAMLDAWNAIKARVAILKDQLDSLDVLEDGEFTWVGGAP